MKKKGTGDIVKDVIIYGVILAILITVGVFTFIGTPSGEELDRILKYVGSLVTILLGVLGIIEFAYNNGLFFMVPTSYIDYKERSLRKQTKEYLHDFFTNEVEYFSQYSNCRITYFLNQLGINSNQLDKLKMSILSIKLMPLQSIEDARKKIIEIIKTPSITISQDGKPSDNLVYKDVNYFLNFTDIVFIDDYRRQITDCLAYLIQEAMLKDNIQFNRVAIPYNGNFLLGNSLSHKLNKALIRITEKPMIFVNHSWTGNFEENGKNRTIIINDVLVTGDQIKKSKERIENDTSVVGYFFLVSRMSEEDEKELSKTLGGVKIYSLLKLDDNTIEQLSSQSGIDDNKYNEIIEGRNKIKSIDKCHKPESIKKEENTSCQGQGEPEVQREPKGQEKPKDQGETENQRETEGQGKPVEQEQSESHDA